MKLSVLAALFLTVPACAATFSERFVFVMIDDATEAKLGAFPYDRSVYAQAVEACARSNARAVVLKFFLDETKSPAGDTALARAMTKIPTVLQARMNAGSGETVQPIPARFSLGPSLIATAVQGNQGWIPLPDLLATAAAVGFIDFAGPSIPLVERYQGIPYKSVILCCLELAIGAPSRPTSRKIYLGAGYLPVDAHNVFHADDHQPAPWHPLSFERLLAGEVPSAELADHIVIIGWDSAKTPTLPTPHGVVRIHRLFAQLLAASYATLTAETR